MKLESGSAIKISKGTRKRLFLRIIKLIFKKRLWKPKDNPKMLFIVRFRCKGGSSFLKGEFYSYCYREKRFLFCNRGSSFILCRLIVIRGWNSTIIVLSCLWNKEGYECVWFYNHIHLCFWFERILESFYFYFRCSSLLLCQMWYM